MQFREATIEDIDEIVTLVNVAYRGEKGWTTENALVDGDRTTSAEVLGYITNPKSHLFVMAGNSIKSIICVEEQEKKAYIGFFAVHPSLQGEGIGKELLQKAENFAINTLGINHFTMSVLADRVELIEFYERRGYIRTNLIEEYPKDLNVGTPKKELKVIHLEKVLKNMPKNMV